ncbi:hypothetical protein DEU56DRAFT_871547 [Suillus clintonianus]|uniref:uncharacterized protein n=1 Tax=Suillus clintonianus TaxID=1904413 RepID=UPI001B8718B7|nr:uncharacterized protein DEU56DRAFT_871547 [Suillus clintonianus]KAG2135989.1 hypothetical protein DEU56DRAFT_871547 [Suillus clintonianus]
MPQTRHCQFNVHLLPCTHPGCCRQLKNKSALTQHLRTIHQHLFRIPERCPPSATAEVPDKPENRPKVNFMRDYHLGLDGRICNKAGQFIDPKAPPPAFTTKSPDDWTPFPGADIDKVLHFWGITLAVHGDTPPFADRKDLHNVIDNTPLGDVPWESFNMEYAGDRSGGETPWMKKEYEVFYCDPHKVVQNMLANPDYKDEIDFAPYREWEERPDGSHNRQWRDFMSGDWAWEQADIISADPATHGSTFIPIILGSDKTTVSVATGQNDYYPLYLSIGNVHNNVRQAHRNAVALVGFLAIPKTTKKQSTDPRYRKFKKELFHTALVRILESIRPAMTTPEVARCADGHYRCVIYGIGPYIADYEEQVVLAGIVRKWCCKCTAQLSNLDGDGGPRSRELLDALIEEVNLGTLWDEWGFIADITLFTNNFLRADIYKLIAPDLLHQIIKGIFKDHLVAWVQLYLEDTHSEARAKEIMDDIDRRIAVAPSFSGLRRFPEGRGFSQWTGDDSKALMKVYLSAIEGHVPTEMVRTFRTCLEFCYIARHDIITDDTLKDMEDVIQWFHVYREIFKTTGVRDHFSLPRQHSISHYPFLVRQFGAPNGLCSSITESKHIKAVKEPWRRSRKFNALGQMVRTNTRIDQLAAARIDFTERGMLYGTCASSYTTYFERKHARTILNLGKELHLPELPTLLQYFLYDQLYADDNHTSADVPLLRCPNYTGRIQVVNSAVATYFAPSDPSGVGGMHREHIRSTPSWRGGPPRYDCVFVSMDNTTDGINGMDIARVLSFFSFSFRNTVWLCAVVHWFKRIGSKPDEDMGMWMVRPSMNDDQSHEISIIHVDSIFRAAHLVPMFGDKFVPEHVNFHNSLDAYMGFYVNRFADHHAFEIAS